MHCPPYLPNILADCRNHISATSLLTVAKNPFSPVMCTFVHTSFLDCLCVSASLRLQLFCKAFSFPVIFFIDGRLAHVIQSNTADHAMKTAIGGPSNTTAPAVIGFSDRQAGTRGEEIIQREQSLRSYRIPGLGIGTSGIWSIRQTPLCRNSYHAFRSLLSLFTVSSASITSFNSSAERLRVTFEPPISYVNNGFLVCSSTATFSNKKRGDNTPLVACQAFSHRPFKQIGIVSA